MFDRQKRGDRAVLVLPDSRGEGDTALLPLNEILVDFDINRLN